MAFKGSEFIPKRAKILSTQTQNFEIPNHSGVANYIQSGKEFLGWKDENIGGTLLTKGASNQPSLIDFDGTTIKVYSFAAGATNELHGVFELQHDYKEGTDLIPHVHFYSQTTNIGNIKCELEYSIRSDIGIVLQDTITATATTEGIEWQEFRKDFSNIDGSNLKIGNQVHFRLARLGADVEDTYTGNCSIATFGIHYQINTIGSSQITSK